MQREAARRDVFERYIGEIAKAINAINGTDAKKLYDKLLDEARKRTAIADAQLDADGKVIKKDEHEDLKQDEGVVMVESRAAHLAEAAALAEGSATGEVATDGVAEKEPDLVPLAKATKAKPAAKKASKNDGQGLF
jgi:hypothetical protein